MEGDILAELMVPTPYLAGVRSSWTDAWQDGLFRKRFLLSFVAAIPIVLALPHFFAWIDTRPGTVLNDPVLRAIGPMDLSTLTFTLLYGGLFLAVALTLRYPHRMLRGMHAYVIMVGLRLCTMALFTLDAPERIIPLVDPITLLFYPGTEPFLKDLFFSGHTASLVVVTLMIPGRSGRFVLSAATCAVAIALLAQHVHWTVDVLAAPVFAFLAWRLARYSASASEVA